MTEASTVIVNYHYCRSGRQNGTGVSPQIFDAHVATLAERFEPLDVETLSRSGNGNCGQRFLLTFDDGSRDVVERVLPVLKKHAAPCIAFCCSQPYLDRRVLNVQKVHLLNEHWGWREFRSKFLAALDVDPRGRDREACAPPGLDVMYRYDDSETAAFKRLLNVELPYEVVTRVLDRLFESVFGPQDIVVDELYMSLDDIRRCADAGIVIGIHTHSHCMLSRLSPDEQAREIDLPLQLFREQLGIPVTFLSYPYGIRGSWNDHTKIVAASRGVRAAFTLGRSIYCDDPNADPLEIPRFDVNDVFAQDGSLKLPA